MVRVGLRGKILLYSSALIVTLIAATLVYVNFQAEAFVDDRVTRELDQGRERIAAAERERLDALALTARLVASFPSLKALLATDLATVRDFLLSYQQENRRAELLIVLDPAGKVIARTDSPLPLEIAKAEDRWLRPALTQRTAFGILATESGVYHAASVPAEAGGTVFGFVIAALPIDAAFARTLREQSQDEIVLVGARPLGTTLNAAALPHTARQDWEQAVARAGPRGTLAVGDERYLTRATTFGEGDDRVLVVLLQSLDRALAPYRNIQIGLAILGVLVTGAGVGASALLSRSVTAPVEKLVEGTREVAAGNFDFRLDIRSGDEIGHLAESFNQMIRGLRERADMQKFVSQSTVEMIRALSGKFTPTGERRTLTVVFTDMRGFTAMSEQMPPEEVVKILNDCLSLQAEQVKKFRGDIDKYVGDCVVAVFAGEDHALDAVRCAVEIHKALDSRNGTSSTELPITVGAGIVTGEVVLGSIGSAERLDFTVIGSNVNLCARLCAMAGARETLLAESTYELVRDLVAAERLEPLAVKGFSQPVSVYRMKRA